MKFWLYCSTSLLACTGLLWYTYQTRQQFYPSVIYLVTSKVSVLILGNAGLTLTMLFGRMMKSIFFGSLRDAEVEILHENVRYAITETCLALTIFRDEINFQVVVLFMSLMYLKIFHWLAQSRIEFIEQSEFVSRLTHFRLTILMTILAIADGTYVIICGLNVMETGPSVFILFGFEFLILFITLISTFIRYLLCVIDARMENNWANKFTYVFYLELISEILKLLVYLVFFMIIFTYYGMPLHIVRDLWLSIKNLQNRIISYFRYRKITANLNDRFPNPTEEELQETDRTCIICREEMTSERCKKLQCSHIFHVDCLKMWVQRQQTCPTCRSTILAQPPRRPPIVRETPIPEATPPQQPVRSHNNNQPHPEGQHTEVGNEQGRNRNSQNHSSTLPHPTPGTSQFPYGATHPLQPPPTYATNPFPFMQMPGYGVPTPFGNLPTPASYHHISEQIPPNNRLSSETIQMQIDALYAQLAFLQGRYQVSTTNNFFTEQPTRSNPENSPLREQIIQTAESHSQPTQRSEVVDDEEEKLPAPQTQDIDNIENIQEVTMPERELTEAERRRAELRMRYNKIYSQQETKTEIDTQNEENSISNDTSDSQEYNRQKQD